MRSEADANTCATLGAYADPMTGVVTGEQYDESLRILCHHEEQNRHKLLQMPESPERDDALRVSEAAIVSYRYRLQELTKT